MAKSKRRQKRRRITHIRHGILEKVLGRGKFRDILKITRKHKRIRDIELKNKKVLYAMLLGIIESIKPEELKILMQNKKILRQNLSDIVKKIIKEYGNDANIKI